MGDKMPYQVVEEIKNATDVVYETLQEFVDECFRGGYDRDWLINRATNTLIDNGLGTEEEKNRFLTISNSVSVNYGEWDKDNQSLNRTKTFESESDYNFLEDISVKVYNVNSGRYSKTAISQGVVDS